MKTKLMVILLAASGAMFAGTRVSIGVSLGGPAGYGAAPVSAYQPPCPGPGYVWIDGSYDAYGNWFDGYWALPPYAGAYWVAPRLSAGRFSAGYWGGAGSGYRGDYRLAPRESERREPVQRGNEFRERGGGMERERGANVERGRDTGRGLRR